jgi:hypothetical protein
MWFNYTVNRRTYPEGPTCRGTTACAKRVPERVESEVEFIMDRLTNLYCNLLPGSEVPPTSSVLGFEGYVVPSKLLWSRQAGLVKVSRRRVLR